MCNSIKELMNGNTEISGYYQEAEKLWNSIDISDENLMDTLISKQLEFEHTCGGRILGQEIMVCYGMMQFLESKTPDIKSAKKVANAFRNNSIEVKALVADISKRYTL